MPDAHARPIILSASKGLEETRSAHVAGHRSVTATCAVLSGPSFAQEVAAASPPRWSPPPRSRLSQIIQRDSPRHLASTQRRRRRRRAGGTLKNVIALAPAWSQASTRPQLLAALITGNRRDHPPCVACGARQTLAGLSGLGDLVLTCTGSLSRNRSVGIELGKAASSTTSSRDSRQGSRRRPQHHRRPWSRLTLRRRDAHHEQMDAILHRNKSPGMPSATSWPARPRRIAHRPLIAKLESAWLLLFGKAHQNPTSPPHRARPGGEARLLDRMKQASPHPRVLLPSPSASVVALTREVDEASSPVSSRSSSPQTSERPPRHHHGEPPPARPPHRHPERSRAQAAPQGRTQADLDSWPSHHAPTRTPKSFMMVGVNARQTTTTAS